MTTFRNIWVSPSAPVDQWGVEGLGIALERGDLADWRRIADAVRHDPQGGVAADLVEAIELADDAPAAIMLQQVLAEARDPSRVVARRLRTDVRRTGLTISAFAELLGTSRSRLSTYLSGKVTPSAAVALRSHQLGSVHRL